MADQQYVQTPAAVTAQQNPAAGAASREFVAVNNDAGTNNTSAKGNNLSPNDAIVPSFVKSQQQVDAGANLEFAEITPRPNILDNFSSYTYHASFYLMSPEQYKKLITSRKKVINGYQLLFQSGGAPINRGGFQGALGQNNQAIAADAAIGGLGAGVSATQIPNAGQTSAGRNPAFDNDFYIDSITISNSLPGKLTGAAHAVTDVNMTVIEPYGITLIDRLYEAVQDISPRNGAGAVNYNAAHYLLVLRFYGYDENGNLVPGITGADPASGLTDPNAIIEKYIPVKLKEINFTVANKVVSYDFKMAGQSQFIGSSTKRGTIPYDVQLSSTTVGKLLTGGSIFGGDAEGVQQNSAIALDASGRQTAASDPRVKAMQQALAAQAPPKANNASSSKPTIKQGLFAAMNKFQEDLCKGANQRYSIPDTYEVAFASGAEDIRDASLVLPGKIKEASQTPMAQPLAASASGLDSKKIYKDTTIRNFSIVAGMQIVQAIDLAIRNSTYITNQQLTNIDPITGNETANPNARGKTVNWFNITFSAEPKAYDPLRNDYAYNIKFIINKVPLQNYDSKYFPVAKFRGVQKSYPYWFTGKNTAVLEYQEKLNGLYNATVSGTNPSNSIAEIQRRAYTSSNREIPYYVYQSASTESRQGTENKGNEASANLAESLYSPGDLTSCKVKIVGDPAWIQQGSLSGALTPETFSFNPFLPDGTISFDAQQVLFEILWKKPEDYNLQTGVIDPTLPSGQKRTQNVQSRVYQALKCVSEFRQGRFEQTLEGGLYLFAKPKTAKSSVGGAQSINVPDENTRGGNQASNSNRNNAVTPKTSSDISGNYNFPNTAGGGRGGQGGPSLQQLVAAGQAVVSNNGANLVKQAALYDRQNTGVKPAPLVTQPATNPNSQNTFEPPPPQPNDTVNVAPPPSPATSDGEIDPLSQIDFNSPVDYAEVQADVGNGVNIPPKLGRLTPDQVAAINQNIENDSQVVVGWSPSYVVKDQLMSRDA